jgi:hypothetical protein
MATDCSRDLFRPKQRFREPCPSCRESDRPSSNRINDEWNDAVTRLGLPHGEAEAVCALMIAPTEKSAAAVVGVKRRTFHARLERVYRRLGVSSRMELAQLVFQVRLQGSGLVSAD